MEAVIFGGCSVKREDNEYSEAYKIGAILAVKGIAAVNGGYDGIMEAVSKGAVENKGKAVGITLKKITDEWKKPNIHLSKIIENDDLLGRIRAYFNENTKMIIVFPGGTGTLSEMMLAIDFIGLGIIKKIPIYVFDYWKPVIEHALKNQNLVKKLDNIHFISNAEEFKEIMNKY